MKLRHEVIEQPQQRLDDPVLATDEGLQQCRDQSRRQGSPNDQSLVIEYLEETRNPADQISNGSSTTNEEIRKHSCIITVQQRENILVEDDRNITITGNHVETVGSDGITVAAATPAPRQETFRGSSITEIAGRSNKDKIHSLGGKTSQRFKELDLQGRQSEREQLLMNELNLVKSENQDLSRRIGEMEAKFAIFEQSMSMRSKHLF